MDGITLPSVTTLHKGGKTDTLQGVSEGGVTLVLGRVTRLSNPQRENLRFGRWTGMEGMGEGEK